MVLNHLRENHLYANAEKCSPDRHHISRICHWTLRHSNGPVQGSGCPELTHNQNCKAATKVSRLCKYLSEIYTQFQQSGFFSYFPSPRQTLQALVVWRCATYIKGFKAPLYLSTFSQVLNLYHSGPTPRTCSQTFSPCVFFSRKLTLSECNTLSKYPFLALTDHRNLKYILSPKALNSHQARWALLFACFKFNLLFRPGCKKIKADALSHLPDSSPIISPSIILAPITWGMAHQ